MIIWASQVGVFLRAEVDLELEQIPNTNRKSKRHRSLCCGQNCKHMRCANISIVEAGPKILLCLWSPPLLIQRALCAALFLREGAPCAQPRKSIQQTEKIRRGKKMAEVVEIYTSKLAWTCSEDTLNSDRHRTSERRVTKPPHRKRIIEPEHPRAAAWCVVLRCWRRGFPVKV